jgi:putative transposase
MQRLSAMYAEWFNWRHRVSGHLFQGRFHSTLVETDEQFGETCRYVALNPVRAGICDDPGDYRWSSYLPTAGKEPVPSFLALETIVELFGGRPDPPRSCTRPSWRPASSGPSRPDRDTSRV